MMIKPESGKDTIGSKPSTNKTEISDNKSDKIRSNGSVTKEKNDATLFQCAIDNSPIEAGEEECLINTN